MKRDASELYTIESISELMRHNGLPKPSHPLVTLVDYNKHKIDLRDAGNRFSLDFYKISFKTSFHGQVKYGQGYYDFEDGGLAFLAPGQVVTMSGDELGYQGYALYFHPDLIRNYGLGKSIHQYGFFSYAVSEALCLSEKEKQVITSLFNAIALELDTNIDSFSQDVLVSHLELLLNYSNRYYNRQFLTRKPVYTDLIGKMELYLKDWFNDSKMAATGLPTVQQMADHLNVSPRYLTDLLKSLTGQSAQQHIHNHLIEQAKILLSTQTLTVAEVAYTLGFEHPQSFNKLFKKHVGVSPGAFSR